MAKIGCAGNNCQRNMALNPHRSGSPRLHLAEAAERWAAGADGSELDSAYYERRASAFRLALAGRQVEALAELDELWGQAHLPAVEVATDVGWVRLLAGEPERAVASISLGVRGKPTVPAGTRRVLAACVLLEPSLSGPALRAALAARRIARVRLVYTLIAARLAAARTRAISDPQPAARPSAEAPSRDERKLRQLCAAAELKTVRLGHELKPWAVPADKAALERHALCKRCSRAIYVRVEGGLVGIAGDAFHERCDK